MTDLERDAALLQERFGRPGAVAFEVSPLGGVVAVLTAGDGKAVVALQGAQVLSWVPQHGEPDVLWCSPLSRLGTGKPVRGGIPICWPWFGPHSDAQAGHPAHGFVRAAMWAAEQTDSGGSTASVTLRRALTPAQQQAVGGDVRATLRVALGKDFEIGLTTANSGQSPMILTGALHSYFAVGDIGAVSISGLEGRSYLDQLTGREASQTGTLEITGETDQIYWDTSKDILIRDDRLRRVITVESTGSDSTVVWNPWRDKSARLGDMPPDSYRQMVCVETANVGPRNTVTIVPGASHEMTCRIICIKN